MTNIKQIKLYTVDHDYGINPNPFFGYCTIGHCKPAIRKTVAKYVLNKKPDGKAEDLSIWLVGIASGNNIKFKHDCGGKVIYIMQVTEVLSYRDYWNDTRFICKRRTNLSYNTKNISFLNCGDNIKSDVVVDCSGKAIMGKNGHVLISDNFIYWGDSCSEDLGHSMYESKTGGGRYPIYLPNSKYSEKMKTIVDFITKTFGETKHADILGKPIMSADNFNLAEAIKQGALR